MEAAVAQFMAFSGTDAGTATAYLEMSGGDVEIAMGLFFGDGAAVGAAPGGNGSDAPPWYRVVWGEQKPPEAWTQQKLEFCRGAAEC